MRSVGRLRTLALTAVALSLAGCASAGRAWRSGPAGIPAEMKLRNQMVAGQYGSALAALKDKHVAPADVLLRQMYRGLIAMHAGQSELGTTALDRAWQIAHDRWTKRLRDGAASMVTGEGALPYYPGPAEQMMIPYYGSLNWLARNERDEAAVEARRLAALLESDAIALPDRRFQGVMRYVSGVIFEMAGERNDADVAYRNASALLQGALPGDTIPPDEAHGDVVVLIEDGFVARPEPASLDFWLNSDEVAALNGKDENRRMATFGMVRGRRRDERDWAVAGYRTVSLRWPAMPPGEPDAWPAHLGARVALSDSSGGTVHAGTVGASVSDAVRADFERAQPARIARALARAALREAELKGAGAAFDAAGDVIDENRKEKRKNRDAAKDSTTTADNGGGSGLLIAALLLLGVGLFTAHVSSTVLDQPDLRAWQLLPDRVTIARLRLPVGEHTVEVTRDGEAYSLGAVTVRPGSVTVLVHRWWADERRAITITPPPLGPAEPLAVMEIVRASR